MKVTSSPSQIVKVPGAVTKGPEPALPVKALTGKSGINTLKGEDSLSHITPLNSLRVIL